MKYYELLVSRDDTCLEGGVGNDWEGIVCPSDPGHQRAGRRITLLHVELLSKTITDFSRTMLSDIVITQHALNTLKDLGLSGFDVKPTVVSWSPKLPSQPLPILWELEVTGRGGHAHPDSGIVLREQCSDCGYVRYSAYENGLIVDERSRDGSDIFTLIEYPKHILVTERAKSLIEGSRLSNVEFVESSKLVWPSGVVKP